MFGRFRHNWPGMFFKTIQCSKAKYVTCHTCHIFVSSMSQKSLKNLILIYFPQLDWLLMSIYLSLFIIYCQYLFDFISHLEEGLNFQLPPLPEAEVSPNLHLFAAGRPIHRLTDTFPTIFASLKPNFQLNLNIFATVGTLMRRKWNHLYRSGLQVQRQQAWI